VYVAQDVPSALAEDKTRVFAATSGYWRPNGKLDLYHFALVDLAGGNGANLTNGSVGVDAHPVQNAQLTLAINHVSTDLLQIAARTVLSDPDPTAIGVVQNDITLLRISQDLARAVASIALAERRFELSLGGGFHRRPAVVVALADGGTVAFPEARSADVTFTILDRRSLAGTRAALSGALTEPLGHSTTWSRATVVRASVSKPFAEQRGELELDVMGEHVQDQGGALACTGALDPLACYGHASTNAAQVGGLLSWRVAREWLLVADAHVGYQKVGSHYLAPMNVSDPSSPLIDLPITWPTVISVTGFLRLQWRYR
jgi:hypothetical protein